MIVERHAKQENEKIQLFLSFPSLCFRFCLRRLLRRLRSPHVIKGFRNPGNLCLWNPESWALDSGIQLKESGILMTIGIQNPSSTDKQSGFQCLESRIQDYLECPYMGRVKAYLGQTLVTAEASIKRTPM